MLASIIFQRLAYRRHGLVRAFHRGMRGAERALAAALLRSDSAGRFPQ
jgi:hypothetical protein